MNKLSVYIVTFNEADKIADALKSVDWADEILVVDSNSSDDTVNIAIKMGATVKQLPFTTFGKLRNDAIASCQHDWIFSLDSDERCTKRAKEEILQELLNPKFDAYYIPRRNWFMGRWINHCGWYPDYRQPQLFRKEALIFDDKEEVHESFQVKGNVGYISNSIIQVPYKNLDQMLHKMQRYSNLGALKLSRKGKPVSMLTALFHGLWAFFRIYVIKLGFLDGWAGFVLALGNFEGTFYRYAKATTSSLNWIPPKE